MIRRLGSSTSATRNWASDPRFAVDVVVAAVVAVLAVADLATTSNEIGSTDRPADALAYALVVAGSASLIWRRRAPCIVLAFVAAVVSTIWLRGHGSLMSVLGLPALYAVAAHGEPRRRAWWALILACGTLLLVASVTVLDTADGFAYLRALSVGAFLGGAVAAGVVIRNRERIFVDTERRAAEAEADRLAAAERAVIHERRRIAREMHDVVAHGMSVVAVQAAAGQEIVRTNPDKAAEVFARIEASSRESLTELRRMLGVLRDSGDERASLAPQPGISDIAAAVEQASATGVPTQLVVEGRPRPVGAGIELAAYRLVQEALTNVRKHAGTSATAIVRLTYQTDRLTVEVSDDGRGAVSSLSSAGSGNGLIGMRERAEIYGGEFRAGPRAGGGYTVHASLPIIDTEPNTPTGPDASTSTSTNTNTNTSPHSTLEGRT